MRITTRAALFIAALCAVFATHAIAAATPDLSRLQKKEPPENALWVDTLDVNLVQQSWGQAHRQFSVDGNFIHLEGKKFHRGIGTHALSEFWIDLNGAATRFVSAVGVDDEVNERGSVQFEVWVDGEVKHRTPVLRGDDPPRMVSVDLTGAERMTLLVTDGGDSIDYDHADWAGALLYLDPDTEKKPVAIRPPVPAPPELARGTSEEPRINPPRAVGTTPGRPFIFRVPVTGEGEVTVEASNLPEGLEIDPGTGIITGTVPASESGVHVVDLTARNPKGKDTAKLIIAAGPHMLALTPPLGWNSWNVFARSVDQQNVHNAAKAMHRHLADYGWQFVNIDDGWEGERDEDGVLQPNDKFPDMPGLADYVHSKGLKLGIYSSPGPRTCQGLEGSYQHEQIDINTWADWGIDYLKYDWCYYSRVARDNSREELMKPYQLMRDCLDRADRDIVYSVCQYGMGDVWKWANDPSIKANCWRTTGDIRDTWPSMAGIGFMHSRLAEYAGPGHWNDADMLVVGRLGWGNLRDTRLTTHEQVTHITLWSMIASPMLLGCDLTQLDDFTKTVLTNPEVLAVNQDPLGKAGTRVSQDHHTEAWARPLWDGTNAVALFNRGIREAEVSVEWTDIGLNEDANPPVRDLWRRKDMGRHKDRFSIEIPRHGAVLLRVGEPMPEEQAVARIVKMYQKRLTGE